MEKRAFGNTGINVTPLGYGTGKIGEHNINEKTSEALLNAVLDNGINLLDTAGGYGLAEDRIGRYISHRRSEYILSTKVGNNTTSLLSWTYDNVIESVESSLRRMRTDFIDIVHLHSCPSAVLQDGAATNALVKLQEQGKIGQVAYAGENEALGYSIDSDAFSAIQTSINIFDQNDLETRIPEALDKGMGIIAKRPLANAPWRFVSRPAGAYFETYWDRMEKMGLEFNMPMVEVALRFTVFSTGAHASVVGSTDIFHIKQNIQFIEQGALPIEISDAIKRAFKEEDRDWVGEI